MQMWIPYIEEAENEQTITDYVSKAQGRNNFTDFYFISRNGEYITLDGSSGYLELRKKLGELILEQSPIAVNSVVPDKPEIMVFAVPCSPGSYRGFEYEAIAITYNNSDLVEALKISAFDGQASTFAVLPDGRVVLDNSSEDMLSLHNIIAMLEDAEGISAEEIAGIRDDLQLGHSGAHVLQWNGRSYYLLYEPVEFQSWTVIGMVPADVVNANMNKLQSATVFVVSGVTIGFTVLLLLIVIMQNQRRLRRKDNELLARDELFSRLSGNVDDIFLMLDAGTLQVDYVSPNVEKLLGISEEAVRGDIHSIGAIEVGSAAAVDTACLSQMHSGEQLEWDREYLHQKSGEERLFHVIAFVSDIQGEKKYIVDMSDRTNDRKLNQALQTAVETAENANRAKSAFLSSMSHDIRTPMNAIVGFTRLAKNSISDPKKAEEYLDKIQSSSDHLLALINDVLDMSCIESGKTVLNLNRESIADIVGRIDAVMHPQVSAKNKIFTISTERVVHDSVVADRVRLTQIIMNLLSNAVKYTPDGGRIHLYISENSFTGSTADYEIVVEDNGFGMSREYQKIIFDSFTREEDGRISKIEGTGLGMAITKNLVDLMGGSIRVESEKGKGSRFTVDLPLRISQEAPAAARQNRKKAKAQAAQEGSILKGMHILAAEDNILNAEILDAILEMVGADCEICENGEVVVDAFLHSGPGQYDLILMDVQMPVMNGYDATRAIRASAHAKAKTIPIISMTANAFAEDVKNALAAGMNAHVAKPLDLEVLEEAVKQCMLPR